MKRQLKYGLSLIFSDYDNFEKAAILFFGIGVVFFVVGIGA